MNKILAVPMLDAPIDFEASDPVQLNIMRNNVSIVLREDLAHVSEKAIIECLVSVIEDLSTKEIASRQDLAKRVFEAVRGVNLCPVRNWIDYNSESPSTIEEKEESLTGSDDAINPPILDKMLEELTEASSIVKFIEEKQND